MIHNGPPNYHGRAETSANPSEIVSAVPSPQLLLVDDREENIVVVRSILRKVNVEVVSASSEAQAMSSVLRSDFAAILLDVNMPQMDGIEMARHLRSNRRTRDIPVLFLSAVCKDHDHNQEVYNSGADDYLIKPVDPQTLLSKVRVFVELQRQRMELEATTKELERVLEEQRQAEQERRRLEKKLQQSQKFESMALLASGIAHDLNNMLAVILGNADVALLDVERETMIGDSIEDIKEGALRATKLATQMLAYSGRNQIDTTSLDLTTMVEEMAPLFTAVVSKNTTIELAQTSKGAGMIADASQIRQVIINLITNASEALGDNEGTITITSGSQLRSTAELEGLPIDGDLPGGLYAFLEIADDGVGMSPEILTKVFDPFFTTKELGHGLGLAAVQDIVRGHSGTIEISSELGQGTKIRVLLPSDKGAN